MYLFDFVRLLLWLYMKIVCQYNFIQALQCLLAIMDYNIVKVIAICEACVMLRSTKI